MDGAAPGLALAATVPALPWDGPAVRAGAWLCHGPCGAMEVDVLPLWSLLGSASDRRASNPLGRGYGDGTPHDLLQPSSFSIPRRDSRRRRSSVHPEVYPPKHRYTRSFTEHAQALPAASGARNRPGQGQRAPSHAPDHRNMEAEGGITQQDLHGPTEGCGGCCSALPGHRQSRPRCPVSQRCSGVAAQAGSSGCAWGHPTPPSPGWETS